jgi:hypothetical protein
VNDPADVLRVGESYCVGWANEICPQRLLETASVKPSFVLTSTKHLR